ncbi:hypothetical protein ACFSQJ_06730 [Croceitalea marina]|uniref:DUF4833 domain-containing protein n=1 Tax=Croceitalea marina TaxID=1775166 RepID=A0ABW5MV71_9FLAO
MAKKKSFWSSEKIMSTSAVVISILTLAVFIYQTNLIRKEQHTAVFPYLELGHSGIQTDFYRFTLENKGIGPAIITDVKLHYEKKEVEERLAVFISKKRDSVKYAFNYDDIYINRFITAGEEITLISPDTLSKKASSFFEKILLDENLDLEITYESIYGDSWKISKLSTGAQRLD